MRVLSRRFRRLFLEGLERLYGQGQLTVAGRCRELAQPTPWKRLLQVLRDKEWVVYAKEPCDSAHVLKYLSRYVYRVAISNHRLIAFTEGKVTFRWKDYARGGKQRLMTLTAAEFLRRFLLHILPRGFVRIRFYGFLASRKRGALLPICQQLLEDKSASGSRSSAPALACSSATWNCPLCGGPMMLIERLTAQQVQGKSEAQRGFIDTS